MIKIINSKIYSTEKAENFSKKEFKNLLLEIDNEKYIELFGQNLEDA